MSERNTLITDFLSQTIWRDWRRDAIQGDASNRQYWRLVKDGQSVILMDDNPALGGSTVPFAQIANLLLAHGLCPPNILAHDPEHGLMVITDLGQNDVAAWLRTRPGDEAELYRVATDILIVLDKIPAPTGLDAMTPKAGAAMLDLVGSHYCRRDIADLQSEMETALHQFAPLADTIALRDFHAENLIWRPAHADTDRIGLLDFQDAFLAPAGYDLVSLLRDARRDVGAQATRDMLAYFMQETGVASTTPLSVVAIQRNLRILGIFGRLAMDYGKPRYLDLIPRVWGHIATDLADPALGNLREAVHDTVPAPSATFLSGFRA